MARACYLLSVAFRRALSSCVAAWVLTGCAEASPRPDPGQFVVVGIRGDESQDQELLRVDFAAREAPRVLIERAADQRFVSALFTSDGSAVDVVRTQGEQTQLLRVPMNGEAPLLLSDFPPGSFVRLPESRTPDGRLCWLQGSTLVQVDAAGELQSTDLTHLDLPQRDWKVVSSSPEEFVFYADWRRTEMNEAHEAQRYLVVTNARFELTYAQQDEAGNPRGCRAAPDATALTCATADGNNARSYWIERSPGGVWQAPVFLGLSGPGPFSADSSTFVAAAAVRRQDDPQHALAAPELLRESRFDWGAVDFSPDGRHLLLGATARTLLEVDTQRESVIGRFAGIDGHLAPMATWSSDGQWLYQGQCERPSASSEEHYDTYSCEGSLVHTSEAIHDCHIADPHPSEPPAGCDASSAPALTVLAVRP